MIVAAVIALIRIGRGYSSGIIMGIAIYGVTIGVAVLIVVLAVMTGFDFADAEQGFFGMDSHLIVTDRRTHVVDPKPIVALAQAQRHVLGAAPSSRATSCWNLINASHRP